MVITFAGLDMSSYGEEGSEGMAKPKPKWLRKTEKFFKKKAKKIFGKKKKNEGQDSASKYSKKHNNKKEGCAFRGQGELIEKYFVPNCRR